MRHQFPNVFELQLSFWGSLRIFALAHVLAPVLSGGRIDEKLGR